MNKFVASALIAVAGFAAAPSFAGQYLGGEVGYFAQDAQVVSTVSRDAVRAEATQAARNTAGEGSDLGAVASNGSTVTRADVRADTIYAVQHGLRIGGEV